MGGSGGRGEGICILRDQPTYHGTVFSLVLNPLPHFREPLFPSCIIIKPSNRQFNSPQPSRPSYFENITDDADADDTVMKKDAMKKQE